MNRTRIVNGQVVKSFVGATALDRMKAELAGLESAAALVPVPGVLSVQDDPPELVLELRSGVNMAQELQDRPQSGAILLARLGTLLSVLQQPSTDGTVLVHGDFGPQNVLVDGSTVTAVVDWEWSAQGACVNDPAWLEWTILMHYPSQADAIAVFYEAYGTLPAWTERHESMLAACRRRLDAAREHGHDQSVTAWEFRLRATESLRDAV